MTDTKRNANSLPKSATMRPRPSLTTPHAVPAHASIGRNRHAITILEALGYDLRVRIPLKVPFGQKLTILMPGALPAAEISILGVVHWVQAVDNGAGGEHFEAGVALQDPVPNEFLVMHQGEERASIRYPCHVAGTIHWGESWEESEESPSNDARAVVINYSRSGICLHTVASIPPDTRFQFTWHGKSANAVTGIVRRAVHLDDAWLIGGSLESGMGYLIFWDHYDKSGETDS